MLRLSLILFFLCCFTATGTVFASQKHSTPTSKTCFTSCQGHPDSLISARLAEDDQDDSFSQVFIPVSATATFMPPKGEAKGKPVRKRVEGYKPLQRRWLLYRRILC